MVGWAGSVGQMGWGEGVGLIQGSGCGGNVGRPAREASSNGITDLVESEPSTREASSGGQLGRPARKASSGGQLGRPARELRETDLVGKKPLTDLEEISNSKSVEGETPKHIKKTRP